MAMLDGLRNIFMQSLRFCKNKISYDFLVEKWNEECEEVYKYKQALIAEERAKHKPEADVVEVKHGNWIECGDLAPTDARCKCSLCSGYDSNYYGFCHNCGAKMDGGEKK